MAVMTVFSRNTQDIQFRGMLMGLEFTQPRRFLTTFTGDRTKIRRIVKDTNSVIVEDLDIQLI